MNKYELPCISEASICRLMQCAILTAIQQGLKDSVELFIFSILIIIIEQLNHLYITGSQSFPNSKSIITTLNNYTE